MTNFPGTESGIRNKMIEELYTFCVEVAQDMVASDANEVRPFLALAWESKESKGAIGEVSLMDAAMFHETEDGIGKDALMGFINGLVSGDSEILAMVGGQEGRHRTMEPLLVGHVVEAWSVSRPLRDGKQAPSLPQGQSVSDQIDRAEVVLVQVHARGRTVQASCPLVMAESGRKVMVVVPIDLEAEFSGRLVVRPE